MGRRETAIGGRIRTVQGIVEAMADELGKPVGVDDADLDAVAYSIQPVDIDAARRHSVIRRSTSLEVLNWLRSLRIDELRVPRRLPANQAVGMRARVCVPVRHEGRLLGFVWLFDEPERVTDDEMATVFEYASEIAATLDEERREDTALRESERVLVRELISGHPTSHLEDGLLASSSFYAIIVGQDVGSGQLNDLPVAFPAAADEVRRTASPHRILSLDAPTELVVLMATDDPALELEPLAWALSRAVQRHEPEISPCFGVGAPRRDPRQLRQAYLEAVWAGSRASGDGGEAVVSWESLGASRTILSLLGARAPAGLLPDTIVRLLESRDASVLMTTLETYLDRACDAVVVAEALGVHRSSLWERLHRIEQLTGVDLRSGDDRLELHLGLRLWRLSLPRGTSVFARASST